MATFGFHPDDPANSRINTREMLREFVDACGLGMRPLARALDTDHSALLSGLNPLQNPPTLDTMSIYARRARKLGVVLEFHVSGGEKQELKWTIHRAPRPSSP